MSNFLEVEIILTSQDNSKSSYIIRKSNDCWGIFYSNHLVSPISIYESFDSALNGLKNYINQIFNYDTQ